MPCVLIKDVYHLTPHWISKHKKILSNTICVDFQNVQR